MWLTTSTDVFVGVSNADDTFTGTEANFEGDSDILVDGGSADNDTLNVTGTAFSSDITSVNNTISGIENINVAFNSLVQSTFVASGVKGSATITVSQSRSGGSDDIIVQTTGDGSTVVAGSGVNTLTVSAMTAGYDLTVDGGSATGTITADLTTDGILSVTADTATSINVSTATGNATVAAAAATTIDVETTSGDISITTDVDSNIDADSTIAGDIVIVAAASEDVVANTTGAGVVTVTAEGNAITTVAKTATINVVEADTTATDMSVTGTGTADSVTINLGDDATVTNAAVNAVETITINATAAAVVTVDTTAATTYVGDANTTFAGDEAMFDGKTVTGAAGIEITTAASSDLSKATVDLIDFAVTGAGAVALSVASGANVELSADIHAGGFTIDADDDVAATYVSGTLNLDLSANIDGGTLTIDNSAAADDGFDAVNLTVSIAQTSLDMRADAADVVVTGSKALVLDATSTAGSFDASGYTGAITLTTSATFDDIQTGSAADTITVATDASIDAGAGNDGLTISGSLALAATSSIDGGAGTDTVTLGGSTGLTFTFANNANDDELTIAGTIVAGEIVTVTSVGGDVATYTVQVGDAASDIAAGLAAYDVADDWTAAAAVLTGQGVAATNESTVAVQTYADVSLATLSNVEVIALGTNTLVVSDAQVNDTSITFTGAGAIEVEDIGEDLDMSNHVFNSTATVTIDFVTNKTATLGANSATSITGTTQDDAITTGGGADVVYGGEGDDTVTTNAGNDTVYGQDGADVINAGNGVNYVDGGDGADQITGGTGVDTIVAGEGADTITGAVGADVIDLTETTAAIDTVILTTGGAIAVDAITGFTVGATNGDLIQIDLSDINALVTDLNLAGDLATGASADATPTLTIVDDAYDLGTSATTDILLIDGAFSASTLETALEVGGDLALTGNGAHSAGDAFLVAYSDGTDTYLAYVKSTAGIADNATFVAGDLTVTNIAKLVGIADATTLVSANIDIIA